MYLLSRIRNRKLAVALGVLAIVGVIIIDLAFSGAPALSLGILAVVLIIGVLRLALFGRWWPRGPDEQR